MSLDLLLTLDTIEVLENYIDKIRPSEELRDQIDIGYKLDNQSIIIFESRPYFHQPDERFESAVAKATFVKAQDHWKVFWQRSNLKWQIYAPQPFVKTIDQFVALVEQDEYYCFWG
ncbi:Protein of unknown function [Spirosoma fluviale]|uniref:DUF3024 domain-containing protein n=2 Tax=Spirosoma fluviale TaxID=1597977 RepID=A0A286F945_9BACT|nr:Protein of unknown function [Spirosoma fluviale]